MIKEGASMMIMTVIKAAIMTGYHVLTDFFIYFVWSFPDHCCSLEFIKC